MCTNRYKGEEKIERHDGKDKHVGWSREEQRGDKWGWGKNSQTTGAETRCIFFILNEQKTTGLGGILDCCVT